MQYPAFKGLVLLVGFLSLGACGTENTHQAALINPDDPIPSEFDHVVGTIVSPAESLLENCAVRPQVSTRDANWSFDFQLDVALIHPDGQCLPPTTKVSYWVYGYDNFVADVSATRMGEWMQVPVHSGDFFRIGLDAAAFDLIEYQSGVVESLRFYTGFSVDLDGNGEVCNGDLAQNYDVTDFASYPYSKNYVLEVVQLKVIDYKPCQS